MRCSRAVWPAMPSASPEVRRQALRDPSTTNHSPVAAAGCTKAPGTSDGVVRSMTRLAGAAPHGASATEAAMAMRMTVVAGVASMLARSTVAERPAKAASTRCTVVPAGSDAGARMRPSVLVQRSIKSPRPTPRSVRPVTNAAIAGAARVSRISASASSDGDRPLMPGRQARNRSVTAVMNSSGGPSGSTHSVNSGVPAIAVSGTR